LWTTFRLSVAQAEEEEHQEMAMSRNMEMAMSHNMITSHTQEPAMMGPDGERATVRLHPGHMSHPHRASTAVSLALRTANVLAQAEDLILFNGQNAVANAPLFTGKTQLVSSLDLNLGPDLGADKDFGLLNIQALSPGTPQAINVITLPPDHVFPVHPVPPPVGVPVFPPLYQERTLDAVANGYAALQGFFHYENYALVLHTYPYADLHQALPTTLIEPVEPVSHLIKAGIYGSGTLPPFTQVTATVPPQPAQSGLPTHILDATGQPQLLANVLPGVTAGQNVLYTGVLVSLSGNTMDMVRGHMEDHKDVIVTFNQKDQNEQYRFRTVQRFALRLKDPTAVILFLFMDS
jgi:hypothetical protein